MQSAQRRRSQAEVPGPVQASPPTPRSGKRLVTVVAVVLLGAGLGVAGGLLTSKTAPDSDAPPVAGTWTVPDLSAQIEPAYQQLFETARTAVAEAVQLYPGSPQAISSLGVLCYLAHDREKEKLAWQGCLEADPANSLAYSRLFSLAEEEADYQRIVELAERAIESNPDNPVYRGRLGSALLYLKKNQEAIAVLEPLVRSGKGDADAYFVLGEVCYQLNELTKAERYYSAAVALAPFNSSMQFSLVKLYTKLGQPEQAAAQQKRFQELKAAEAAAQKDNQSARQKFRDEVHIPTRVSEILRFVGQAYQDAGESAKAEQQWTKAAELSPDDPQARQLLANLYDRQGKIDLALQQVRELQRIEPSDYLHRRNEGRLLARLGRPDEAERVLRDLCQQEPTRSAAYAALAELLLQRGGDLTEAKAQATRAVELEPTSSHFGLLASVAYKAGDLATARASLEQALSLDPGNPDYRRFYASLTQRP